MIEIGIKLFYLKKHLYIFIMNLVIDYREHTLLNFFENYEQVEKKNLDIGDVIFYYENEIVVLIERKTVNDMVSSILDGRHREQKIRIMNSNIEHSKIIYLIEGDIYNIYHKSKINTKTVVGCMVNTLIRDNIKVFRTQDIKETILFIDNIRCKLISTPNKLLKNIFNTSNINYVDTIKLKKKDNLTTNVCSILQLAQIPSVSKTMAEVIIIKYGSIFNLCKEYQYIENSSTDTTDITNKCETLLKDLKYDIANSKKRAVGPKASKKIYHYLCNKN